MRYLFLLFLGITQLNASSLQDNQRSFVIVVASYNNAKWYEKNLSSIFDQDYPHYRVIYVDDASPDGTAALVEEYIKQLGQEHRTTLICNQTRNYSMANLYKAIWLCDPKEIVVEVDGDDWLAHNGVLSFLNQVYSDPSVWTTYGQLRYHPCGSPGWAAQLPDEVIENNAYRDYPWQTTHLRSYYASLFHAIQKDHFLIEGEFVQLAGDFATFFPILEMAGKHSRFIPEVLYIYNANTGINDIATRPREQETTGFKIRAKKRYLPLEKLPIP